MNHPYSNLPAKAFWSSGVAKLSAFSLSEIYQPRASIDKSTRVATAGSCFAQHISREFRLRNYNFLDLEPAPPMLPEHQHADFGFGIYSARYGNVYSIRQLLQIVKRANGDAGKQEPFWEKDDKFFDPYRPNIQKMDLLIRRSSQRQSVSPSYIFIIIGADGSIYFTLKTKHG